MPKEYILAEVTHSVLIDREKWEALYGADLRPAWNVISGLESLESDGSVRAEHSPFLAEMRGTVKDDSMRGHVNAQVWRLVDEPVAGRDHFVKDVDDDHELHVEYARPWWRYFYYRKGSNHELAHGNGESVLDAMHNAERAVTRVAIEGGTR